MTDRATKSFEIRTARQYLDELLRPAYTEFLSDRLSSRKAIVCAIFAWHLRDWIWAQHKAELRIRLGLQTLADFDSYLFKNCPELSIIQEVATGSKHLKASGSVQTTELAHGFAGFPLVFTQSHLIAKTDTGVHFSGQLFKGAVAYWQNFFDEIVQTK